MKRTVIAPGEIRIEAYSFDTLRTSKEILLALLTPDERARFEKILHPEERVKQGVWRGLLRSRLGDFLGLDPREIRLGYGTYGKPYVIDREEFHFNLSHSGDFVVLAFSLDREVGVDIERMRLGDEQFDLQRAMNGVFAEAEMEEFRSLPEAKRLHSFYCGWTRKEAFAKGLGLGLQLTRYPNSRVSMHPARSTTAVAPPFERRRWTVKDFKVDRRYRSAIAFGRASLRAAGDEEPQVRVYRMVF